MNLAVIIGNCGVEPEIRQTSNGKSVANLRIATSEFKGSGDTREERTEWHNVVLFDKTADIAGQYLHKGDKCSIEGRIQTRKWKDKSGNDRSTTEIVANKLELLTKKRDSQQAGSSSSHDDSFDVQELESEVFADV
tara:strand:+ start:701 stop:1108 length:408 start_codon:yes stop_codon:yes gene_type:complete